MLYIDLTYTMACLLVEDGREEMYIHVLGLVEEKVKSITSMMGSQ